MEELVALAKRIEKQELREQIMEFLTRPEISIETFGDEMTIEESPASKKYHHSYPGGLIEHTVSMTLIALEITAILKKVYQIESINKDLLLAGGILHDLFKPYTYSLQGSKYGRSKLGSKIDHTSLMFAEAWTRKLPLELLHVILAHHGKGSPAQPRSLEALILHLADYVDSNLLGDLLVGAEKIIEQAGKKQKLTNSKFAARICDTMVKQGLEGVKNLLSKPT
ncbi:MAG: HD domain-containing protein [Promethearchaeota archaeon]|nr:MAG: HD domain-containing protein [Candidatus Lokiarchaeota archaeon]